MGIEPTHKGFADLSLTTWVPRHPLQIIAKLPVAVSAARCFFYFFAGSVILASRRKRAASSGGVGLM